MDPHGTISPAILSALFPTEVPPNFWMIHSPFGGFCSSSAMFGAGSALCESRSGGGGQRRRLSPNPNQGCRGLLRAKGELLNERSLRALDGGGGSSGSDSLLVSTRSLTTALWGQGAKQKAASSLGGLWRDFFFDSSVGLRGFPSCRSPLYGVAPSLDLAQPLSRGKESWGKESCE